MKMLIAHYSWSNGNTKRIAGMLLEKTNADNAAGVSPSLLLRSIKAR